MNKLNDLVDVMEPMEVYSEEQITKFVDLYLGNASREKLDPILDVCVENFKKLEMDDQIQFKGGAKSFVRTYNFLFSTGLELYKAFYGDMKNKNGKSFQKWLLNMVFNATYES